MRLSTSSVQFGSLPIERVCERIAALGFDAIDIWAEFYACRHLDDAAERLGADGLRDLLAKHNLQLSAITVYLSSYEPFAKLLGRLGGGIAIRSAPEGEVVPEDLTRHMKSFFEQLKPLIDLAEQYDSYLAIENYASGFLLTTLDSFKAFMDLNPSPRVGVALAPYHLQANGTSVTEAIRLLDDQLLFFYAWQRQPELNQLPGYGTTDVVPWLKALAEIGYAGYVNPFMRGEPEPDAMCAALSTSRDHLLTRHQRALAD
ncbi:MAG: hypothetical protein CMJ49_02210 [Planctomycetaceae bacterium]|nr:hypothetical protein [Planctomycetaceae bacterium]